MMEEVLETPEYAYYAESTDPLILRTFFLITFFKILVHSSNAPNCAGLPKFEAKIHRNKKVMA